MKMLLSAAATDLLFSDRSRCSPSNPSASRTEFGGLNSLPAGIDMVNGQVNGSLTSCFYFRPPCVSSFLGGDNVKTGPTNMTWLSVAGVVVVDGCQGWRGCPLGSHLKINLDRLFPSPLLFVATG